MSGLYEVSEEFKYPDPVANNAALTDHAQTGLLWRDALASSEVKVLSASQFTGRFLGIDDNGQIAWVTMPITDQALTAFGELSVAQSSPVYQISFRNGNIQEEIHEKLEKLSGTVTFPDLDQVSVKMAAVAGSQAYIQSREQLRYRPGQGSIARQTAVFATPIANTQQLLGQANFAGGFFFGYNGTSFGIMHMYGGMRHVHKFVVTVAATGATNATVTLNGTGFTVPLSITNPYETVVANRVKYTAYEIGKFDYSSAGFLTEVYGDTVYFLSHESRPYAGTFSFSHATATATVSLHTLGVAPTESFVAQASWNGADIMDGSGESGVTLDPTKGNVYQIRYQWLGYGLVQFSIENAETDSFEIVHVIKYPNANTSPSIANPSAHSRLWVRSTSGTPSGTLTAKSACFFGANEGVNFDALQQTKYSANARLENTSANLERPLITIRNDNIFNNRHLNHQVRLWFIAVSSDSNKPVTVRLRKNGTVGNGTIDDLPVVIHDYPIYNAIKADQSAVSVDYQAENVSGGTLLATFKVGKVDSREIDLSLLNITLRQGDLLSMSIETPNGANDISASMSWAEDHT